MKPLWYDKIGRDLGFTPWTKETVFEQKGRQDWVAAYQSNILYLLRPTYDPKSYDWIGIIPFKNEPFL